MNVRKGILIVSFLLLNVRVEVPTGPVYIRGLELAVLALVAGTLITVACRNRVISNYVWTISVPVFATLAYAILLIPFQPYPTRNTFIDLLEVSEVLIGVFAISYVSEGINNLTKVYDIFIISSLIESIFFFSYILSTGYPYTFLGSLPYYPAFGFPSVALIISIHKAGSGSVLKYLPIAFILVVRVFFQYTRSNLIFIPIALAGSYLLVSSTTRYYTKKNYLLWGASSVIFLMVSVITVDTLASTFPGVSAEVKSIVMGESGLFVRACVWYMMVVSLIDSPFGVGLNNTRPAVEATIASGFDFPDWLVSFVGIDSVERVVSTFPAPNVGHSSLFKFFVEMGPFGLAIFTYFWWLIFSYSKHACVYATNESFENIYPSLSVLMYFFLQSLINTKLLDGWWLIILVFTLIVLGFVSKRMKVT